MEQRSGVTSIMEKAPQGEVNKQGKKRCHERMLPKFGEWVTVKNDKRSKHGKLVAQTPCVVAGVMDATDSMPIRFKVLYPNVLSEYLHNRDNQVPLLFIMEVHPTVDVETYAGTDVEMKRLEGLLKEALLRFVAGSGRGLVNNQESLLTKPVAAPPTVSNSVAKMIGDPRVET